MVVRVSNVYVICSFAAIGAYTIKLSSIFCAPLCQGERRPISGPYSNHARLLLTSLRPCSGARVICSWGLSMICLFGGCVHGGDYREEDRKGENAEIPIPHANP
jgi:hypothetical protein